MQPNLDSHFIRLNLLNFENEYNSLQTTPIMLNDVPANTEEERKNLNDLLMVRYDNNATLDTVPRCDCSRLSTLNAGVGDLCEVCNTRVEPHLSRAIKSRVWMKAPEQIEGLISPIMWTLLSQIWTCGTFNGLRWFCNPYEEMPRSKGHLDHAKRLLEMGIPRGLNSLILNLDKFIEISIGRISPDRRNAARVFFREHRDKIVTQYLPLPSRQTIIVESTESTLLADTTMKNVVDAARSMTSIDMEVTSSIKKMERRLTQIIDNMASYYSIIFGRPFSNKKGDARKTVLGSRLMFGFRSVIVSHYGRYDTFKLPYSVCVSIWRLEILNILTRKKGMSALDASNYINQHQQKIDPLLSEILMSLFKGSSGGRGKSTLFIRYPTLERNSITRLFVNGFTETTATLSILVLVAYNADFDGDQLSGVAAGDEKMAEAFELYAPHFGIYSFSNPGALSGSSRLPEAVVCQLGSWIEEEEYAEFYPMEV